MGMFLEATGCGETTTNGLGPNGQIVKVPLQSGKNLYYNGPNLAGTGIKTCDDLNTALSKIDTVLLELKTDMLAVKQTLNLI
jgi:hypothetical protein